MMSIAVAVCSAAVPAEAQQATAAQDSIRNCVRTCAGGETMPVLLSFPRIDAGEVPASTHQSSENPAGTGGLGQVGMHGAVLYTVVINPNGEMDRSSLRVYSSNARKWEAVLPRALEEARFRPAADSGRAVRARVLIGFDIRAEGFAGLCYAATVLSNKAPQKPLSFCYENKGGE
jgi:hypothetical protein